MEEAFKKLELEQQWTKHFELLSKLTRQHDSEVGDSMVNRPFNRYADVKTYDKSRVKLNRLKDIDYINANFVTVPKAARQYILTQGPLKGTCGHFWLMIWEQKSNVIVMLNRILELEEYVKCEQYWPSNIGLTDHYEDVNLSVTLKSFKSFKHYAIRELLLEDKETDKSRTVLQFHYTAWPDHDQPDSPTSFLRLLAAVRKCGGLDKMDEPPVIHCSAGIGRSGTFCLIDSILTMVENQGSTEGIDINKTIIEMRDYRMGLIQSPTQLRFAYLSIIYGIKILEKANKLHHHITIKDATTLDNGSHQRTNGSAQTNGKKTRRNKKKQNSTNNPSSLNVFKKDLLVDALDDIDSDSADRLFYDTMKPWPEIKRPRNSSPEDYDSDYSKQLNFANEGSQLKQQEYTYDPQVSAATKAQMLSEAINSMLAANTISTTNNPSTADLPSSSPTQNNDSVLLRRRERELRNLKLAEKTLDIKNRMKAEELKRENYAKRLTFLKRSALVGGVAALVVSSLVYAYFHGNRVLP